MGSRTKSLASRCLPICWLGGQYRHVRRHMLLLKRCFVKGHIAFGGFGLFSRVAGLLQDRVTAAEVVLANGTTTTASATKNSDLFWALRGAGASYGIVTQWSFATLAAPPTVISYFIEYTVTPLSPSDIATLMEKWQSVALSAPNELPVICTIKQAGGANGTLFLEYRGTYYGTQSSFDSLTSDWATLLSPGNLTSQVHSWYDGLVALSGPLSTSVPEQRVTIFAKSLFTKSPVTAAQWTSLLSYLGDQGLKSKLGWYIEIDRYGGGVAKLPADATSFAPPDAVLCFQFVTGLLLPPFPSDSIPFLNGMLSSLDPNPQAAYVSYVDSTLTPAQWKLQYYGSHYPRLLTIKRAVDPHNVFRFPQSIGLFS
ncbi:hypothetical protein FRC12_005175 [Ceratobasidium sp. 428]|nr:hypothetical protein FRC12_005175 [Ceratobasidium sp. 428]